jgi:ABC-type polysaccharide/polyol phosphate export permease
MLTGFLGIFWLTIVPVIIMVAVPFIYSYILHKKGI